MQAISHETPTPATPIATTPQKRLNRVLDGCILILRNNPALCEKSGRDLEMSVQVEGKTVSYKTWNEAKKQV